MTRATFAMGLALAVLAGACGGDDGKKTRQACTDDTVCGGGVCFEQECYEACSEVLPCADDEVCVRKQKGDAEVDLCVVAADFFDAHAACVTSQPDCDDIVRGACQIVGCHDGRCVLENRTDGIECFRADGEPDVCVSGHCGERTSVACDDPTGVWTGSVRRPEDQIQAECVIDGYVTHGMTLTLTVDDGGAYTAGFHVTNVPDRESGTCSSMDGVYPEAHWDAATRTLTLRMEGGPAKCDGEPSGQNEVYTFVGTLSADCTTLDGVESKEPGDPCNPDTPPFELQESFTKQTGQPHAAFR